MKRCPKCNEFKDESRFSENTQTKDGLQGYCKDCFKSLYKTKISFAKKVKKLENTIENLEKDIKNIKKLLFIYDKKIQLLTQKDK